MKPEGPNNSPLVILKAIMFPAIVASATIHPMSGFLSSIWGVPFHVAFMRLSAGLSLLYIALAVVAGHQGRLMSAEVRFDDKEQFVSQVTAALIKRQYQPAFREGNTLTFKPPFLWGMYDPVTINLGDGSARVVGPRICVKCVVDTAAAASNQLESNM